MKEQVKYVFVILVYRNTSDLEECLDSIEKKVTSYKTIVVNAYYDDASREVVSHIASSHDCDFINIENRGYSFGNNRGIDLATEKYDFQYVIISNPDIVVEQFDDTLLAKNFGYDVVAPRIIAASGRRQNPMAVRKNVLSEKLEYIGFKRKNNLLIYSGIFLSKFSRWFHTKLAIVRKKTIYPIFEAHGSFVLLSKHAIEVLYPVYDENMFLFAEEGVLAAKATKMGLKTCYFDHIHIQHKEDGSMKLGNFSVNEELRKANIYSYETYFK